MYLKSIQTPALTHLRLELRWLMQQVVIRLREMQDQGLVPAPEVLRPGTVISPQEVEVRIRGRGLGRASQGSVALHDARQHLALIERERVDFIGEALSDDALPLVFLKKSFGLSDADYFLLLLTIAPAFNPDFPRLYGYLQNHFEHQYPTVSLLMDAFSVQSETDYFRRLTDPESPLIRARLIEVVPIRPYLVQQYQPLRPTTRLLTFIEGDQRLDPTLSALSEVIDDVSSDPALRVPEAEQAQWTQLVTLSERAQHRTWELPVILFRGLAGSGKRRRAFELARLHGLSLLTVELEGLQGLNQPMLQALQVALREAVFQRSALCLCGWDLFINAGRIAAEDPGAFSESRKMLAETSRLLEAFLATHSGLLFLTASERDTEPPRLKKRHVEVFDLELPDPRTAASIWTHHLSGEERAEDVNIDQLASDFRLTPGQIKAAAEAAQRQTSTDGPISQRRLIVTIKDQIRHRLSEQAYFVEKSYAWEDLIVSREVEVQMRELISRYRYRNRVLEDWGLGSRFGSEQGLSALFEGPPGTGKTMSASLIARELGMDLYQIDLSKVVSRYVGETEKNLGRIFDEAERAQSMLLFDEADSLFAKRTEVKSSNDRYANLEVNFLLQRIETFSGVAILTTNFASSIDDAFARRLSMRISFSKPGEGERQRLWASMLSNPKIPKRDIDCEELAAEFELSGGHIKNAILRAAFIAASRSGILDQDILYLAARIELKEQGMLIHGNPLTDLLDADS